MAGQPFVDETLARSIIEQCRREIAAAWIHIEAAREGLRRTSWLSARWSEQIRMNKSNGSARPESDRPKTVHIGMFVFIEPETPIRSERRSPTRRGRRLPTRRPMLQRPGATSESHLHQ
jgi:hypothetical protein